MAENLPPEPFASDEGRPPGADGRAGRPQHQGSMLRSLGNPPRRRLPARAALGVALVVGGALTFGLIQLQLTGSRSVLAAARDVASGHVIQSGDLRVVNVGMAEGITPIASSDQDSVLGHTARVDILSGALLTAGDIGTPSVAGGDEAILAVSCRAGRFPPSLAPGDWVHVIDTGVPAAGPGAASPAPAPAGPVTAIVSAVDAGTSAGSGGAAVISLRIKRVDLARLAQAGAAGRLTLVLVRGDG